MYTTLEKIREHYPCSLGWAKLLKHLGKSGADSEPLAIVTILDSNGLDDALWCFRAVSGHDRELRLFAVWCARQVQHLLTDPRSIAALDVAEHFANGEASQQELDAAAAAARVAARDSEWAAGDAAWAAARVDAWDAARVAAWDAARVASWAAGDAAWAAGVAAWAAQEKELRIVCARIAELVTA